MVNQNLIFVNWLKKSIIGLNIFRSSTEISGSCDGGIGGGLVVIMGGCFFGGFLLGPLGSFGLFLGRFGMSLGDSGG